TMVASLRSRQLSERTDLELEYRLLAPDGRPVWVRESSRFSPGHVDDPRTLRGVLVNINKRKRIERRLYYARGEVESQVRELGLLQDLCERLTLSIDLPDVLDEIVGALTSVLGTDAGSVALYDPARDEIRFAAATGLSDEFLADSGARRPGDTPCSRALTERRSVSFQDIETNPEYAAIRELYRGADLRAVFATPLLSHSGEAFGVLAAYFHTPHRPSDRQQTLVELYARQAGQIVTNVRRHAAILDAHRRKDEVLDGIRHKVHGTLSSLLDALRLFGSDDQAAETREAAPKVVSQQARHLSLAVDELLALSRTGPTDPAAGVSDGNDPVRRALAHGPTDRESVRND
ncbi:MAG: GAF domain-containing protein, partial [Planctomycetia bacterium]|nr:GAF domain-containing protein [Planctomycetia bacterium]